MDILNKFTSGDSNAEGQQSSNTQQTTSENSNQSEGAHF
jgi:hypothetical protein